MGMQNPTVGEPLDKLSDHYPEGTPFFLLGIRIVEAKTKDYGKGEMVVVRVRGHERELGIWGAYLLAQAKSVDPSDLNKWYKIRRRVIEGFGGGNPSKEFYTAPPATESDIPVDPPASAPDDEAPDF